MWAPMRCQAGKLSIPFVMITYHRKAIVEKGDKVLDMMWQEIHQPEKTTYPGEWGDKFFIALFGVMAAISVFLFVGSIIAAFKGR